MTTTTMNNAVAQQGATFERREMRPVPVPDRALVGPPPYGAFAGINQSDTYAAIRCGDVHAEIIRFAYWHPNDGAETVEVSFDARINGTREDGGGAAEIYAIDPQELFDLAQVATRAAFLLDEARRRHAMGLAR
jgi:hypothetical protein